MNEELYKLDGLGQAGLIKKGEISAKELMEYTIERIQKVNPRLNALASTGYQLALKKTENINTDSLFAGVPVLVKDLIAYPGMPFAMGSRLFALNQDNEGTPYSRAMDESGLIPLGKSVTSEFGLLGSTETKLNGIVRNPWNPEFSASGSSGGSAAAVAGGLVALAHGSDGGGSIRIPASVNGLFGLKPGKGRILPSTMVTNPFVDLVIDHFVTRSVRDSAACLSVTENGNGQFAPVGFVTDPVSQKLKIGMYKTTLLGELPEKEILSKLEMTAEMCMQLGHEIVEVQAPPVNGERISDGFFTVAGAALSGMADMVEKSAGITLDESMLEPFTLSLIEWYRGLPEDAMAKAMEQFRITENVMNEFVSQYDVLLTPVLGMLPQRIGYLSPDLDREEAIHRTGLYAGFTPVHNIAGIPTMSVPLHMSDSGMPVGAHFAAPRGMEAGLLGLAYQLEEAFPWIDRLHKTMDSL